MRIVDVDLDDGKGDDLVRWIRTAHVSACAKVRFADIQTVLRDLIGESCDDGETCGGSRGFSG